MKKSYLYYIFISFSILLQNNAKAQIKKDTIDIDKIAYAEKIYLQLNSTIFTSDQNIWFKGIVTNINQKNTILSNVLHVQLINFDEKIIASKILKLENGIGNNFFDLKTIEPLLPGKYMVRAYTKWNKNFKENFTNKQYIDIYKPTKTAYDKKVIRNVVISEKANKQLELSAKVFPKIINPRFKGKLKVLLTINGKKDSVLIKEDKNKEYTFSYPLTNGAVKAKIDIQLDSIRVKNNNFITFNSHSKTIAIDKNFIDLQFFPEGGKLVHGLTSNIAFKALDYKNEGLPVKGIIKDENNLIVTEFKSNLLGMGFYQLKPDKNKTYYAEILNNKSTTYKFQLPKIYEKGYVLTVNSSQDFFKLLVRSNFSKTDSLFVKVQARGITYFNSKMQFINEKVKMAFKKSLFPEGIVTFTVFNKNNQPICERLVFNFKENSNRLNVNAKADKKEYKQRDKVTFDLNIKDGKNTNTSFLVLNKKQLGEMQLQRGNILSYFLLESELKGKIEQPNFYFDSQNKHRFYAMDALLLTQGWRNYIFKPTKEDVYFKKQPEKNLQISGTIEQYKKRKRKRKKPIELTLMTLDKKNLQANVTTIDSVGRFIFDLQDVFKDDLKYLIQTKNHKGRKKELTIAIDKPTPLKINFEKQEKLQLADEFNIYVKENRKRFVKENPFSVDKNGFVLDEIIVKTRILSPIQKKMTDEHGEPDVIIENEKLIEKNEKWMSGLFSLLLFKFPDDISIIDIPLPQVMDDEVKTVPAIGTDLGFSIENGVILSIVDFTYARKPVPTINGERFRYAHVDESLFTFVIIDGKPVHIENYPILENIPIEEIKSVEIIKNPKLPAIYLSDVFDQVPIATPNYSFLNIYTYPGKGLFGITETKGIFKNTLPSFSIEKEFYAPKHENVTKKDWEVPDLRSTVFWQPNLKINKNGTAKVEFYADDNIGEMLVIIESINEDGKLGYYETSYKVNQKLINNNTK
ncbi:hypothetical protein [uncultured Polaribacter sp.]|uniref:hypothetical protein n=1 Tax=uncultured Polaribacter sp. TaxID=174711 RepID=UPI002626F823|nr:hypothetical protein [uncultured Polaribacter sp.]